MGISEQALRSTASAFDGGGRNIRQTTAPDPASQGATPPALGGVSPVQDITVAPDIARSFAAMQQEVFGAAVSTEQNVRTQAELNRREAERQRIEGEKVLDEQDSVAYVNLTTRFMESVTLKQQEYQRALAEGRDVDVQEYSEWAQASFESFEAELSESISSRNRAKYSADFNAISTKTYLTQHSQLEDGVFQKKRDDAVIGLERGVKQLSTVVSLDRSQWGAAFDLIDSMGEENTYFKTPAGKLALEDAKREIANTYFQSLSSENPQQAYEEIVGDSGDSRLLQFMRPSDKDNIVAWSRREEERRSDEYYNRLSEITSAYKADVSYQMLNGLPVDRGLFEQLNAYYQHPKTSLKDKMDWEWLNKNAGAVSQQVQALAGLPVEEQERQLDILEARLSREGYNRDNIDRMVSAVREQVRRNSNILNRDPVGAVLGNIASAPGGNKRVNTPQGRAEAAITALAVTRANGKPDAVLTIQEAREFGARLTTAVNSKNTQELTQLYSELDGLFGGETHLGKPLANIAMDQILREGGAKGLGPDLRAALTYADDPDIFDKLMEAAQTQPSALKATYGEGRVQEVQRGLHKNKKYMQFLQMLQASPGNIPGDQEKGYAVLIQKLAVMSGQTDADAAISEAVSMVMPGQFVRPNQSVKVLSVQPTGVFSVNPVGQAGEYLSQRFTGRSLQENVLGGVSAVSQDRTPKFVSGYIPPGSDVSQVATGLNLFTQELLSKGKLHTEQSEPSYALRVPQDVSKQYRVVTPGGGQALMPAIKKQQDLIVAESAKAGLDPHITMAVIAQESTFNPNAKSPAGAMGLMQLMPGTAKGLGVANPKDPVQNVRGGVRLLSENMKKDGDIRVALARYNGGGDGARFAKSGFDPKVGEAIHQERLKQGSYFDWRQVKHYVSSVMGQYNWMKANVALPVKEAPPLSARQLNSLEYHAVGQAGYQLFARQQNGTLTPVRNQNRPVTAPVELITAMGKSGQKPEQLRRYINQGTSGVFGW